MSFFVNVRLPNGTCPALAFPDGAGTTVLELKLAVLRVIDAAPDGFEDEFLLEGGAHPLLTNDAQSLDRAGINNEATVTLTRRRA